MNFQEINFEKNKAQTTHKLLKVAKKNLAKPLLETCKTHNT
jgi:hypothetical protein